MLQFTSPTCVLGVFALSFLFSRLNKRSGFRLTDQKYCVYSFTVLTIALSVMCVLSIKCFVDDILRRTAVLRPETTTAVVYRRMVKENDTISWDTWKDEADLEDYEFLRLWAVVSPVWLIATFAICIYHTRMHVRAMAHSRGPPGSQAGITFLRHERTIRVLLLPAYYGLMSFHGVLFTLGVVVNGGDHRHFSGWAPRKTYWSEMYLAAFYVGDIYESYALFVFGQIIIDVLQDKVRKSLTLKRKNSKDSDQEEDESADEAHSDDSTWEPPPISLRLLLKQMKWLTAFGIKLFCWTCGLQAVYQLGMNTMGYWNILEPVFSFGDKAGLNTGLLHKESTLAKTEYFFLGAGFVASFAAIGNVMLVEQAFHDHLHEFGSFWKFLGTKILVSLAFIQSVGLQMLPPFSSWTDTRRNLFYSTTLCFECFLVSLMHLKAWAYDQSWYGDEISHGVGGPDSPVGSSGELEDDDGDDSEVEEDVQELHQARSSRSW